MKRSIFSQDFALYDLFSYDMIQLYYTSFDKKRLHERKKKGLLTNISKGWRAFANRSTNESFLYKVANNIYKPSYVSLESALRYYNFIPETVYTITSITTKKTQQLQTSFGLCSYHSIHPRLYTGYSIITESGRNFAMAYPAKALCDFLYFHHDYVSYDDFDEWRLNIPIVREIITKEDLLCYMPLYNKTTQQRISLLLSYIRDDA